MPGEDASAGAFHILLGTETGLTAEGSVYRDNNAAGSEFARALAIGDMNNDGQLDLAVGLPGLNDARGQVRVMYDGFSLGMGGSALSFQQFGGGSAPEDGDRFGFALDMGDFDRDGFDDLVVGVPDEDHEDLGFDQDDAGAVNIFRGGPNGLAASGHQFWDQDSSGIIDSTGTSNHFGFAVAVGDFNGDFVDDLAVGVPGETEGGEDGAGAVNIIYGALGTGLTSADNEYIHQDTSMVAGSPESFDRFGASLAAGDFNGDFRDDLIVGVPNEDTADRDVGAIHIIPGTASGLTPTTQVNVTLEDAAGNNGGSSIDAFFGAALAVADFDQDGKADIAVGTPGKSPKIGIVHTIYGTEGSFELSNNQIWQQSEGGSDGALQSFAEFGASVAAGDFNGDGKPTWPREFRSFICRPSSAGARSGPEP